MLPGVPDDVSFRRAPSRQGSQESPAGQTLNPQSIETLLESTLDAVRLVSADQASLRKQLAGVLSRLDAEAANPRGPAAAEKRLLLPGEEEATSNAVLPFAPNSPLVAKPAAPPPAPPAELPSVPSSGAPGSQPSVRIRVPAADASAGVGGDDAASSTASPDAGRRGNLRVGIVGARPDDGGAASPALSSPSEGSPAPPQRSPASAASPAATRDAKSLWKRGKILARQAIGETPEGQKRKLSGFGDVVKAEVKKRGGFHAQDEGEEIDEMAQKQFLDSHQTEIPAEQVPRWLIMPYGVHRLGFDCTGMAMIMWLALEIPFTLAFVRIDNAAYQFFSLSFVIDLFFIIDIIANFFTGYYKDGRLVTDQALIAKNYLKGYFLLDLVASFPYDLIVYFATNSTRRDLDATKVLRSTRAVRVLRMARALRVIRLLRLLRLKSMVYKIEEAVQWQTVTVVCSMGKYVLIMIFLAHMEACSWYALSNNPNIPPGNELSDDDAFVNWVQRQEKLEPAFAAERDFEIPWGRYIASLYWAFTTMSTVGYGDIFPVNEVERMFAIASMVVACCCFAMVVGGLQQVLAKFGQERQEFDRMLLKTMRYLRAQKVNRELQYKVKRYLEHNYDNKSQTSMDPKLLANLSDNLKSEVMVALLMPIMERFPLFKQSSRLFLVRMCTGCKTHRHAPGDVVADPGTVASSMYFVVTGRLVMIKVGENKETPRQYFEGYWIGELNLFVSETRAYSILSVSFSEVLEISRTALQQTLQDFPKMLGTYKEMKERIKEGDRSAVEFKCDVCGMPGHADGACQAKDLLSLQPKLPWYSRVRKWRTQGRVTKNPSRTISLSHSNTQMSSATQDGTYVQVSDDGK